MEENSTGGQGSRRAVAPSDDNDVYVKQSCLPKRGRFHPITGHECPEGE